jgi:hypothetical protein
MFGKLEERLDRLEKEGMETMGEARATVKIVREVVLGFIEEFENGFTIKIEPREDDRPKGL